jgi:hypothetical protein
VFAAWSAPSSIGADGLEDARQQRAELQSSEDVAHRLRVDRLHREVGRSDAELDIAQERVQVRLRRTSSR